MSKHRHYIGRLRQNHSIYYTMLVLLWITTTISIPTVSLDSIPISQEGQRILHPDSIPIIAPGNIDKSSQESLKPSVVVALGSILKAHPLRYTRLESYSSDHARVLTSVLVYTQTTSSYL